MRVSIRVDNDRFDLNSDSYEYKCMPDFKNFGNGYLEVSKLYPVNVSLQYESSLLRIGTKNSKNLLIRPYRFWTGKRFTKVWFVKDGIRQPLDILELRLIDDKYHVKSVNAQCLKMYIKAGNYGTHYQLLIRDIYLEEN